MLPVHGQSGMQLRTYYSDLLRIREDDEPLLRAQLTAMERQIPLLYIIILTSVWGLAIHFQGDAPEYLTLWLPGALTFMVISRMATWIWRPTGKIPLRIVKRKLQALTLVTAVITGVLCGWAWGLDTYADDLQRTHVAFFVAIILPSAAFTLAQFPRAALISMFCGCVTFDSWVAMSGEPVMIGLGLIFTLVLVMIASLLKSIYGSFVESVHSQASMSRANAEMSRMNEELTFHRDNLASEVKRRTAELEEHALKLQQALAQEKELNALQNQFVSMVSHEFRTPLTVIDATARRVEKKASGMTQEELAERMSRVRSSVKRLSGLVERTLDASRLANGSIEYNPVSIDLPAFIDEVLDRQKEAATNVEFSVTATNLPATLTGDPQLIDHMLSNVLSNAIKYSPHDPVISITASADDVRFNFVVRDNGVGIPAGEIDKVMERFYRAKTSDGIPGTGIGLNFVAELVEMHNGCICIDSEEGEWTEVTISLPLDGRTCKEGCDRSCKARGLKAA